jgi:CDP-diglyceride synthetase
LGVFSINVILSHFIINNILEGLIWFFVPASLVICNDVFAYICGITMGRTPLIKLSPKKTVEGFVGAFLCTIVFAIVWGTLFSQFNYMICPVHDLGVNAWSNMKCTPNPAFVWREWVIWKPVAKFLSTIVRTPSAFEIFMAFNSRSFRVRSTRSRICPISSTCCPWHVSPHWSHHLVAFSLRVSSALSILRTLEIASQDMVV